jgi:hypothetical protein
MITLIRYIIRGWTSPTQHRLDTNQIRKIQERAESYRIPQPRRSPE